MNETPLGSIFPLLNLACPIHIVDIGANPVDGLPPYMPLLRAEQANIIGFEPNLNALAELNRRKGPTETYLPNAVGDGKRHTLWQCAAPSMNSLFQPNPDVLSLFYNFSQFSRITATDEVDTVRLDDVPETALMDMLKIDIQGAELMVFQNATERLRNAVLIHTEVEFMPMYIGQPLFSDVDQFLRQQGFMLHRFCPLYSRTLKTVDPFVSFNQMLWADAVFIRDITRLDLMDANQLLRLAIILHECYQAYDIVVHLLSEYDRRSETDYSETYRQAVTANGARIAYELATTRMARTTA